MNEYLVCFIEQSFSCNAHELLVTDNGMRHVYTIKADKIFDAYYQAVERVRKDTKELVRLNFCKLKSDIVKNMRKE